MSAFPLVHPDARCASGRPDDIAPFDPDDLACALLDHAPTAYAQIAALSSAQRLRQALAHTIWLQWFGLDATLNEVLAAWDEEIAVYGRGMPRPDNAGSEAVCVA